MAKAKPQPKSTRTPRVFQQAKVSHPAGLGGKYRRVVGEFWTERQRQMNPLHYVISYRASFKPELPAYFIERLCPAGGVVYDPFCGRGTTALQANLMGRSAAASDVNPLAVRMAAAKCQPVSLEAITARLAEVDWDADISTDGEPLDNLAPFYHPKTLRQLLNLREFLKQSEILRDCSKDTGHLVGPGGAKALSRGRKPPEARVRIPSPEGATAAPLSPLRGLQDLGRDTGGLRPRLCTFGPSGLIRSSGPLCNDATVSIARVDRFIELVALSRLHGHSDGFFSVYSFPQISVPASGQRRINRQRNQKPEFRPVAERIIKKARLALAETDIDKLNAASRANRFFVASANDIPKKSLPDNSVDLIVTSPPFLAKANYLLDNWLEFWFAGIDPAPLAKTLVQTPSLKTWRDFIGQSMRQMARVLRPGGHAVIEVGEIEHDGQVLHLDEVILELAANITSGGVSGKRNIRGPARHRQRQLELWPTADSPLAVVEVLIHTQKFTKLANCFKISNNEKGTNTNRLVVLRKI